MMIWPFGIRIHPSSLILPHWVCIQSPVSKYCLGLKILGLKILTYRAAHCNNPTGFAHGAVWVSFCVQLIWENRAVQTMWGENWEDGTKTPWCLWFHEHRRWLLSYVLVWGREVASTEWPHWGGLTCQGLLSTSPLRAAWCSPLFPWKNPSLVTQPNT